VLFNWNGGTTAYTHHVVAILEISLFHQEHPDVANLIGFHGCDESKRDNLLNNPNIIKKSEKP
jgi:hypothetical protein